MKYKSNAEWQESLTEEQYRICREGERELAFTGAYLYHTEPGKYLCACCEHILFDSSCKFDAGTGWPSFWQSYSIASVVHKKEGHRNNLNYHRAPERVICRECDAYLGYVFKDGPQPTGLRYCVNSIALRFEPQVPFKKTKVFRREDASIHSL